MSRYSDEQSDILARFVKGIADECDFCDLAPGERSQEACNGCPSDKAKRLLFKIRRQGLTTEDKTPRRRYDVDVEGFAAMLGRSTAWIRRRLKKFAEGKLDDAKFWPIPVKVGNAYRWNRKDIEKFIDELVVPKRYFERFEKPVNSQ